MRLISFFTLIAMFVACSKTSTITNIDHVTITDTLIKIDTLIKVDTVAKKDTVKIVSIDSVNNYDVIHGTGMITPIDGQSVTFLFNQGEILDTLWSDGMQSYTHAYTIEYSGPIAIAGTFQQLDDNMDYSTATSIHFSMNPGQGSLQVQINASHVKYSPNQARMSAN